MARVNTRMLKFDWDEQKAASNLAKHKIAFAEAGSAFYDAHAVTYPDGEHSHGEPRFLTFGLSDRQRVIVVSHVEIDGGVRIISARRLTREERKIYEKGI